MLFVILQPTPSVRPNISAGIPTYAIPATSYSGHFNLASYQLELASIAMCGSDATIGAPLAERVPDTAQLLLPFPSFGGVNVSPMGSEVDERARG